MSYRRSPLTRFVNRHQSGITWLVSTVLPSVAAALIFGFMIAAPLLHLGNTDASGPVERVSAPLHSSLSHLTEQTTAYGYPDPGTIASGAGLDILEVGL